MQHKKRLRAPKRGRSSFTVERVREEDPDYPGEARIRTTFHFSTSDGNDSRGIAASEEDLAELRVAHTANLIPNRLINARSGLALIIGTPEYDRGAHELEEAERLWTRLQGEDLAAALRNAVFDDAHRRLDDVIALIRHGLRRLSHRATRAAKDAADSAARVSRRAGANAANEKRREKASVRKKELDGEAADLLLAGKPARSINSILARKHRLSRRQIANLRAESPRKRKPR